MWRSYVRRVGGGLISMVGGGLAPKPPLVLAPGRRSNIFPAFYVFKYELRQEISSSTINIGIVNRAEKAPKQKGVSGHPGHPLDPPLLLLQD